MGGGFHPLSAGRAADALATGDSDDGSAGRAENGRYRVFDFMRRDDFFFRKKGFVVLVGPHHRYSGPGEEPFKPAEPKDSIRYNKNTR